MKKEIAQKILNETEIGYDSISKKFSQTRKHFWRGLEFIKDYTHENDFILDFGCGNGRLFELIAQTAGVKYLGIDVSEKLIDLAKEKYGADGATFQKINPNQSTIALKDDSFNTIYGIAVFHHFPSVEYRQEVARELFRAMKSGGHVVVTVWYLWQKKYFKNIFKNWINKMKGESEMDWNDCLISFTDNSGMRIERFHHAFTKGELRKLFESAGFETEKCEIADGRNILYIGKK
ncbi:MAG: hypothetical protein ACD_8C00086G0003 [uncultured bacterium]|nr:MAG: hypothetical protein ACD_8C00086G0003 [uncultured bacterium]